MTATTEAIYTRYMTMLERVSGKGIWMDTGAVRLAFLLAIDDAANTTLARWEAETENEVRQLRAELAQATLQNAQDHTDSPYTELQRLAEWMHDNLSAEPPAAPIAVDKWAIEAFRHLQEQILVLEAANKSVGDAYNMIKRRETELEAANATLHTQLASAARSVLSPTLASAHTNEIAVIQAIVDHGGANGDGAAPKPVKRRGVKAAAENGRLTKVETLALAFRLVRDLNHELSRPPKMKEFDAARPEEDLATAEAVMKRFGFISWMALVDAAVQDSAAQPV